MAKRPSQTRRQFLADAARVGAGTAAAGALSGCFPDVGGEWPHVTPACQDEAAVTPVAGASRVVDVYREDAVVEVDDGGVIRQEINEAVVGPMLDAALAELTDGAAQPWHSLLPDYTSATRIGIKANCLNYAVPTSVAMIKALVASLRAELDIDAARIIVWDRRLDELAPPAPRHLYDGDEIGATILGTINSITDSGGPGYSDAICGVVAGKVPRLSRIITELTDLTINCPVLKNHGISGVTGALKNIYGIIDNPGEYHDNVITALPELYRLPPIRDHIRLTVLDALAAITTGGTSAPAADAYPRRVIVSQDPLALDSYALALVNQLRGLKTPPAPAVDPSLTEWMQNGYELGLGTVAYELRELDLGPTTTAISS